MNNLSHKKTGLKKTVLLTCCVLAFLAGYAQKQYSIDQILDSIERNNPVGQMYNAEIRSMDEAAKGARSWMPPEMGTGFFMTPYNPQKWKNMSEMDPGMGSVMISVQQMFPNRRKLNADAAYMQSMSASAKELKKTSLNELYAQGKKAYVQLMIIEKKKRVLDENENILQLMIKNAELRYRNGMEKINAYYKAKAALGKVQNMRVMLENEALQRRIMLNTLMYRDTNGELVIDTAIRIKSFSNYFIDSSVIVGKRSDIKAIQRDIITNELRQEAEIMNLKPQFGIRYEHMLTFGAQPQQFTLMAMVKLPFVSWASRMSRANVESYRWQREALQNQSKMLINEAMGMARQMIAETESKEKQIRLYELNIIPALRNNYKTTLIAYEQNTEELFMLYDAWESLNMTQNDYLDQLQQLLSMQVELERLLEIRN
jgi:outer membrane protein TolC